MRVELCRYNIFFFQAEDGIRDRDVTGVQTCALPIYQQDGDLERAQELMAKHNTLADSLDRARHYAAIARDALGLFEDGPAKDALIDVVDFCVERAY